MNPLATLLHGLAAVFTVSGLGRLALRSLGADPPGAPLAWHWHLGLTMVMVEAMLLGGAGSAHALRWLGAAMLVAAAMGHVLAPRIGFRAPLAKLLRANKTASAAALAAWAVNLIVALAPATKIDELHYHMLTPKRIVEDGGLRYYLLPLQAAVTPHMHYQIALSVLHAAGAPDAGNILSLAFSVTLILFLAGFLLEGGLDASDAALVAALCAVGLYATVWHTTGGAQSLGDLAMAVAVGGLLLPAAQVPALGAWRSALLLGMASALAAAAKISTWPLAMVVTLWVAHRAAHGERSKPDVAAKSSAALPGAAGKRGAALLGAALLPWAILHLPLMIWTYRVSGSFWGPLLANVLGRSVFPAALLAGLDQLQGSQWSDLLPSLRYAAIEVPPVCLAAMLWILWAARRNGPARIAAVLLLIQGALVAWRFEFDFHYFAGIPYVAVMAAALSLGMLAWPRRGKVLLLTIAAVPWLATQFYYARPFAEVAAGVLPREQFLTRYVALRQDFGVLDRLLPKNAVLYIESDLNLPDFYAPRPVVLTPLDLHARQPVYRMAVAAGSGAKPPDVEPIIDRIVDPKENPRGDPKGAGLLRCGERIYENNRAVVEAYRTPGEAPLIGAVSVQKCEIENAEDSTAERGAQEDRELKLR